MQSNMLRLLGAAGGRSHIRSGDRSFAGRLYEVFVVVDFSLSILVGVVVVSVIVAVFLLFTVSVAFAAVGKIAN